MSHQEICPQCIDRESSARYWIQCDFCDQWYHAVCVSLNKSKAGKLSSWLCPSCSALSPNMLKDSSRLHGGTSNSDKICRTSIVSQTDGTCRSSIASQTDEPCKTSIASETVRICRYSIASQTDETCRSSIACQTDETRKSSIASQTDGNSGSDESCRTKSNSLLGLFNWQATSTPGRQGERVKKSVSKEENRNAASQRIKT